MKSEAKISQADQNTDSCTPNFYNVPLFTCLMDFISNQTLSHKITKCHRLYSLHRLTPNSAAYSHFAFASVAINVQNWEKKVYKTWKTLRILEGTGKETQPSNPLLPEHAERSTFPLVGCRCELIFPCPKMKDVKCH